MKAISLTRVLMGSAVMALAFAFPTSAVAQEKPASPDTVVLTGPRGVVTLQHKKHSAMTECTACHHESKPEKAKTSDYQKCTECHTQPATEPMKTSLRDAFHNGMAKAGTCIDCHTKEAAAGKTVPAKCGDCHIKQE